MKQPWRERLGLWLVYWSLRITGNRVLANVSQVLPLIPQQRLAISPRPLTDHPVSEPLLGQEWYLWDPSGALRHRLSSQSS
jgi:hypothetical protein